MPALDASAPARDAIDEFLRHLADRDLSASTRRIRKTFLNEYLRHAQQAAAAAGTEEPLTARVLLEPERTAAWLADAAEGKTRTRNTLRGPDAAAYPNSMRVRADTVNAFAEFLGEPGRVDRQAPARGYHLTPGDTERLLHELTVKRPIHANAMTALRTAAVAAVIADTGHGVPEIAGLKLSALHLDGDEARAEIDGESYPLTGSTVHILTRWLAARASLIAELEGSDPGYLWIPTKPGRPRGGVPSAKPGISPAAVRTLHASHRALVSQLLGTPLRPGALRAAALAVIPASDPELAVLHDHELVLVLVAEGEHHRHAAAAAHHLGIHVDAKALEFGPVGGGVSRAEQDAGRPARLEVVPCRAERHAGAAAWRRQLYPAVPVAERHVGYHREPEHPGVERDRLVLVRYRHDYPAHLRHLRHCRSPFAEKRFSIMTRRLALSDHRGHASNGPSANITCRTSTPRPSIAASGICAASSIARALLSQSIR
jgi:site-specific recombinase XerC